MKKLPDAEFELMRIIWDNPSPISTNQIIDKLGDHSTWKPQTVLTLLTRLISRCFLRSERVGKERIYYPLIDKQAYLSYESAVFMRRYHAGSLKSLIHTLYTNEQLNSSDIEEIRSWLKGREEACDADE